MQNTTLTYKDTLSILEVFNGAQKNLGDNRALFWKAVHAIDAKTLADLRSEQSTLLKARDNFEFKKAYKNLEKLFVLYKDNLTGMEFLSLFSEVQINEDMLKMLRQMDCEKLAKMFEERLAYEKTLPPAPQKKSVINAPKKTLN